MASLLRTPAFLVTGLKNFTRAGYERAIAEVPATATAMGDLDALKGTVCLITGANQGLGLEISLQMAKRHGTVYMACRNEQRGKDAVTKVKEMSANPDVHLVLLDVSSLRDVERFVDEWKRSKRSLHVLVHNAGVLIHHEDTSKRQKSVDGNEINFATNSLGVWALTRGMEPVLKASGKPEKNSRVIMVSSGGAYTSHLEVDDLQGERLGKDGSQYYAADKRRQIAFAEYFDERWKAQGENVLAVSMHPGWADTEGVRTSIPGFHKAFKDKLRTVEQGADTVVYLAVAPQEDVVGGAFYLDRRVQKKHLALGFTKYSKQAVDGLAERLDAMVAVN